MNKFLLLFLICKVSFSQDSLPKIILLDEVLVSVKNKSRDIDDFIKIIKNDTTFYKSFKYMRKYSHNFNSELFVLDKKNNTIGKSIKKGSYLSNGKIGLINYNLKTDSGRIYKRNGNYRYYTQKALNDVFFPMDTIRINTKIGNMNSGSKNYRDAKTVGFSIGSSNTNQKKGGLSKKLEIFDISMHKYYDYELSETVYNEKKCFNFTVSVKDSLASRDLKKALVRKIVSYFDKDNLNVIYRYYYFVYKSALIRLDLSVEVKLDYYADKHVPTQILYDGYWKIPFYRAEKINFSLNFFEYNVN